MPSDGRDWRESAYLKKENWPEAIPWDGPAREYGPEPWAAFIASDGLAEADGYPASHTAAASVGETYLGDVCPYCGVPLDWMHDEVVLHDGTRGTFCDINDADDPTTAYHVECWRERSAELAQQENTTLGAYADGGDDAPE